MTRHLLPPPLPPPLAPVLSLLIAVVLLVFWSSCSDQPPNGSARASAVTAAARAESTAAAAGTAEITAAEAETRAVVLAAQAQDEPTADRIAAAADARVTAAAARAVANALASQAERAAAAAQIAAASAQIERERDAAAADHRAWVTWCRWLGLAGICSGALVGGLLALVAKLPQAGAAVGGSIVVAGLAALAAAEVAPLLGWLVPAVIAAGAVWWAWLHRRDLSVSVAASRALDAIEADPPGHAWDGIDRAKDALGKAVDRAGRRRQFEILRGPSRQWDVPC